MDNKLETIGFLSCLREMIALSTDSIEGITESEKNDISNFIIKEASDYEILHFIGTGEFPNEKYNQEMEEICVDFVKEKLQENYFDLSEVLGESEIDNLMESLVPLTQYGLSSNSTVLEHLTKTGMLPLILSEDIYSDVYSKDAGPPTKLGIGKKIKGWEDIRRKKKEANEKELAQRKKNTRGAEFGDDLSLSDKAHLAAYKTKDFFKNSNAEKTFGKGANTVGKEVAAAAKKAGKSVSDFIKSSNYNKTFGKGANTAVSSAVAAAKKAGTTVKQATIGPSKELKDIQSPENQRITAAMKKMKGKSAASKLAAAKAINVFPKGDAKGPGKKMTGSSDMGSVGDQITKQGAGGGGVNVFPKGDAKGPGKLTSAKPTSPSTPPTEPTTTKPDSASSLAQRVIKTVTSHQGTIGATVLGAGLLYGAYRTYKRFFSKAARACSGKSGAARDACITNFKKNAIKAQISDLKRSASACKSTNNPQKCQAGINAKIQKLQAKLY